MHAALFSIMMLHGRDLCVGLGGHFVQRAAAARCRGPVSRREFLRVGRLALGGLTLADIVAARGASPVPTSVILFWMWGGPSQLETFDLKPEAPTEYRGPFRPIRTSAAGLDVC